MSVYIENDIHYGKPGFYGKWKYRVWCDCLRATSANTLEHADRWRENHKGCPYWSEELVDMRTV